MWATMATKWRHTPFYIRPNNLPKGLISETRRRDLELDIDVLLGWENFKKFYELFRENCEWSFRVSKSGFKIQPKQSCTFLMLVIQTMSARLIFSESLLNRVKISEKSFCLTFRNIGLNINCVERYFAFYQKLPLKILNLGRIKNDALDEVFFLLGLQWDGL